MKRALIGLPLLFLCMCTGSNDGHTYGESSDGKMLFYFDYTVEKRVEVDDGFENHIMVLKKKTGEEVKRFEWGSNIEDMNGWRIIDLIRGGEQGTHHYSVFRGSALLRI